MEFKQIRKIVQGIKKLGYEKSERREFLNQDFGDGGKFATLIRTAFSDKKKLDNLLNLFLVREDTPVSLVSIFHSFEEFSELGIKISRDLNQKDINLINQTIDFLQRWFYSGEWTVFNEDFDSKRDYNYFAVPAGILNLITKIKQEKPTSINDFSADKIESLVKDVYKDFLIFMSPNNLRRLVSETEDERLREYYEDLLKDNQKIITEFKKSRESVLRAITATSPAAKIYLIKNIMIASEILRRYRPLDFESYFIPKGTQQNTQATDYELFDFSRGKSKSHSSMHMSRSRLLFCMCISEFMRLSKIKKGSH